jgi:predicted Zn-dependent protease
MKNKKIFLVIFIAVFIFSLCGIYFVKNLSNKGSIKKVEYVAYYKKNFLRLNNNGRAKIPNCYAFLSPSKVKWPSIASYVINPTNSQGLSEDFIKSAISQSAETWDSATSKEIANDNYTIDTTAVYGKRDGKNAIVFGDNYQDPNVIGVTSVWYNTKTSAILEFDMSFEEDFKWGDASQDSSLMDLQNIATHELGHAFGMGDIYKDACSAVTMYGYSDYGEIEKRTLEQPDIKGLQTLYGF